MEQNMLNQKLSECAKTVLNLCRTRTETEEDAQDLSQEILCEMLRCAPNLRDDHAFYGFLWRTADNICKAFYRKKEKRQTEGLFEDIPDQTILNQIENEDIFLLRRELCLLSEAYRKATILHYKEEKSCTQIAQILGVSESMVKYLLFKSRKKLKEGMNMERNYGIQSYHPKHLHLCFLGRGINHYYELTNNHLIRQNILWACYNDELREDEIALEIGVGLPYIEQDLAILTEYKLLTKIGKKYRTNIIILTLEAENRIKTACFPTILRLTEELSKEMDEILPQMRKIGFYGSHFSENTLKWNLFHRILHIAYCHTKPSGIMTSPFENGALVWGMEELQASINTCGFDAENVNLCFYDYLPKPNADHHDFWNHPSRAKLLAFLAKNEQEKIPEYGKDTLGELIKLGYIMQKGEHFVPTMCMFTQNQLEILDQLLEKSIQTAISAASDCIIKIQNILTEQTMAHLQEQISAIAGAVLFDPFVGDTVKSAVCEHILSTEYTPNEIATMYLVK